jgi:hypothetical protein
VCTFITSFPESAAIRLKLKLKLLKKYVCCLDLNPDNAMLNDDQDHAIYRKVADLDHAMGIAWTEA